MLAISHVLKSCRALTKDDTTSIRNLQNEMKSEQTAGLKRQDEGFASIDNLINRKFAGFEDKVLVAFTERRTKVAEFKGASDRSSLTKEPSTTTDRAGKLRILLRPEPGNDSIHQKTKNERLPNSKTGDWLKSESAFTDWLYRKTGLCLIYGEQGAGKSFLASNIIDLIGDHLKQTELRGDNTAIAYFYCKRSHSELKDVKNIARSCAFQSTEQDRAYARYILSLDATQKLDAFADSDDLWKLLYEDFYAADSRSTLYLVADGFDELDEQDRKWFLSKWKTYHPNNGVKSPSRIQVLLTCDAEDCPEVRDNLCDGPSPLILNSSKNATDIEAFAKRKFAEAFNSKAVPSEFREQAAQQLARDSQGNFLWTSLIVEEITSKHREDVIRRTLRRLPNDLAGAIQLVLNRYFRVLDEDDVEDLGVSNSRKFQSCDTDLSRMSWHG